MRSLVITLGEPKSINIEILCQALQNASTAIQHIFIGSMSQWQWQCKALGMSLPFSWQSIRELTKDNLGPGQHFFLDTDPKQIDPTQAETYLQNDGFRQHCAVAALNWIQSFNQFLGENSRLAVLTLPINKAVTQSPGFPFPGQTEFFSSIWPPHQSVMILAGPRLRVGLATNHLALKDVAAQITPDLMTQKIKIFHKSLQETFGIINPRLAVAALNPHAGDHGLFGSEDQTIIAPCIEKLRQENAAYQVSGPYPADTVFYRAYQGHFDGVLAIYHDQGLGPLKTVHFHDAINVTGGLQHLRVSPDHGPAEDLFLKNKASTESMSLAYDLCISYLGK